MFTGFASENTPSIKVWNFFAAFASSNAKRYVSLQDDCAPIQLFRTGGQFTSLSVYLPTCPIEGKQITILNMRYGQGAPILDIYSSDISGNGTNSILFSVGSGNSLVLVYSKEVRNGESSYAGQYRTGWIPLNQAAPSAFNYGAVSLGSSDNRANNPNSFVGGGASNTASGDNAVVLGGLSNTAQGIYSSVLGGNANLASNFYSCVVGGQNNQATAPNGAVVGGYNGTDRAITGYTVFPASVAPVSFNRGSSQAALLILGVNTTSSASEILRSNNSSPAQFNQISLSQNCAYYFRGSIIANVTGGGDSAVWTFEGGIKRGSGIVSFIGTPAINVVAADAGASTWAVSLALYTPTNTLNVTVTGQTATNIRWVCKVETTELTY